MNKEKEKTAEELAYYVKSDLDIQEIVKKFQHDLQELDYGNRVAAIRKAIEHLNQGCTVNYVVDGLREWYGITIDTDELKKILLQRTCRTGWPRASLCTLNHRKMVSGLSEPRV